MPGTFAPPTNPSFTLPIEPRYRAVITESEGGYEDIRPYWAREKRRIKLVWKNANRATRDYIVAFFQRQRGPASPWSWSWPTTFLYQPKPALAPGVWQLPSGSQGARTYYVAFTWKNGTGETEVSPEYSLAVSANNVVRVEVPFFPAGVTSAEVYIGTSTGVLTLQGSITTSGGTFTEPASGLVAGASPPTTNTMNETLSLRFDRETLSVDALGPGPAYDIEFEAVELLA